MEGEKMSNRSRKFWTQSEIDLLIRSYADTESEKLAVLCGHPLSSVYGKAKQLGLKKSPAYLESPAACRLRRGDDIGREYRFQKGNAPANKGLRRPGYGPGRMRETQFVKGRKPHTWKPIGSERIFGGYLQRKMTDTGYPPRDWQLVHRLMWEEANGPIPPGQCLIFVDGNKRNIVLDNLRIVTRAELGRKNVVWNRYPRELAETIQLAGALKRKINRRMGDEKQD